MSAKLLYSLSNEDENLKKQMGCMNGLIQFFDPHHFIDSRASTSPPTLTPSGETKQEGRAVKNGSKRSKEKHQNMIKEKQVNPIEPSRLSVSSTSSTIISSSEFEWTSKPEQFPSAETDGKERRSHSSPRQSSSPSKMSQYFHTKHTIVKDTVSTNCASPIRTAEREVLRYDQKHIDSPRLSKPDCPRFASPNESFRSISSNHSAPVVTPKNRDFGRLSYDGKETKEGRISSVKLKDLPRLSLDSKQRTRKDSSCESKDDYILGKLRRDIQGSNKTETEIQEPMSYRAPSNIVAKLMGLQALPDHDVSSPNKSLVKEDGFHKYVYSRDALSRSSSTINETKVDRVIYSPKINCKESSVSQSIEAKAEKTGSVDQEAHTKPTIHSLTVYGAMEKRLADLNFQKSGKDLRALKQILEAMHKEKKKLELKLENQSSDGESQSNNSSSLHISEKQAPEKANPPANKNRNRCANEVKLTRELKPIKHVKSSRKANQVVQDIPVKSPQRLRILHEPVDSSKVSVKKKTAKDLKGGHQAGNKYSEERNTRPISALKTSEPMTKENVAKSVKISENRGRPTTATGYKVKKSNQCMGSNEFRNDSACMSQNVNAYLMRPQSDSSMVSHVNRVVKNAEESCMKYETLQQSPEKVRDDTPFEGLKISTVREQPSPVSVLDANFFEDESPSPMKKKPIAFRDFETNTTYVEPEWTCTGLNYSADRTRPCLSFQGDCQQLENFKESAPAIQKLNSYQHRNLSNAKPLYKDVNLERSYVYEILLASGFLDHPNYTMLERLVHQLQEAISPDLFFVLEQSKDKSFVSDKRSDSLANRIARSNERHSRRLLFDAVNEIVTRKLSKTKPLLKKQLELSINGPQLLQEVYTEIDQLQAISCPHYLDDEEDILTIIIEKDLMHKSANWTNVSGEVPTLILDIERLIFKDLIVELVHSICAEVQAQNQTTHNLSYLT